MNNDPKCTICQFEEGSHSQSCPEYKEKSPPKEEQEETCGALIHTRGFGEHVGPIYCASKKPCKLHEAQDPEEWEGHLEEEFGSMLDYIEAHTGESERGRLTVFIRSERQRAVEAKVREVRAEIDTLKPVLYTENGYRYIENVSKYNTIDEIRSLPSLSAKEENNGTK